MSSVDDPRPDSSSEPFWRGMSVGGLMALMVPVALYFAAVVAGGRPIVNAEGQSVPVPPSESGAIVFTLIVFAISGIVIAVRRRATSRSAVVQWCVPPVFLLNISTLERVLWPKGLVFVLCLWLSVGWFAAFFRYAVWQGENGNLWPKDWRWSSILWGFAQLGFMLVPMLAFLCCFAPLFG